MSMIVNETVEVLNKTINEYLEKEKNMKNELLKKLSEIKSKRRAMERARDHLVLEEKENIDE